MKRSEPPKRRTPLPRSTKPIKRTAIARSSRQPKRTPIRTTRTTDPVTPATRAAVDRRSLGMCEARADPHCAAVGQHKHHRKLRRYGDHTPENILNLCNRCHVFVHANPEQSYEHGWMVRGHDDPEEIPWWT